MSDAISAIGSPFSNEAMTPLHPNANPSVGNSEFLDVLDRSLSQIASRPNPQSTSETAQDRLSSEYGGQVGQAKIQLNGGAPPDTDAASAAEGATLETRLQSLYFELTHYQIAWKIAQNVQRDVSQVLRGS